MAQAMEKSVCERTAHQLATFLADTYILYTKTQNFHWNIVDPRFYSLHLLFEKQYEDLADALDDIAERMRMVGKPAPGTMREFLELTSLEEAHNTPSGDEMIKQLANDHATISKWLRLAISNAQDANDEGSADLMIQRLRAHDKHHWMLISHLKK